MFLNWHGQQWGDGTKVVRFNTICRFSCDEPVEDGPLRVRVRYFCQKYRVRRYRNVADVTLPFQISVPPLVAILPWVKTTGDIRKKKPTDSVRTSRTPENVAVE